MLASAAWTGPVAKCTGPVFCAVFSRVLVEFFSLGAAALTFGAGRQLVERKGLLAVDNFEPESVASATL